MWWGCRVTIQLIWHANPGSAGSEDVSAKGPNKKMQTSSRNALHVGITLLPSETFFNTTPIPDAGMNILISEQMLKPGPKARLDFTSVWQERYNEEGNASL